jgi:hypothetical protein
MLDLNHLPNPTKGKIDYFYGKTAVLPGTWGHWEIWEKPRGINMVYITCIGDGSGGGGGATNNSITARGGGAGGSSGGFTTLLIPAIFLPDRLYISVGGGGAGGAPGNPASLGGAGFGSYVSIAPYTALTDIYTVCYASGGTVSATAASSTATSTAPNIVGAATIANMLIAGLGNFSALAGQQGAAGGLFNNGVGGAITYPTTGLLLSGGAGGGGGSSAGGAVAWTTTTVPAQPSYVYFTGLIGGTAGNPGLDGRSGYGIQQPLLSLGGSGGGSGAANNNTGGNGRPGGIGCGGGGGGAGNPGGTGGAGGPGLVVIQSW